MSPGHADQELILVSNRTAQQLTLAEIAQARGDGRPFAAPPVKVLSLWAGELLVTALLLLGRRAPVTPSHFRIRRLWEDAIRDSGRADWPASDVAALAREAMEADRLCEHWLRPEGLVPGRDWDDEGFCAWRGPVHARMADAGWLNPAEQLRWLRGLLDDDEEWPTTLPMGIRLRGFLELTTLERQLLAALKRRGVAHVLEAPEPCETPREERVFRSVHDEIRAVADWARSRRDAGDGRIGVAVNDLVRLRPAIERAFAQAFHPEAALAAARPDGADYHVHGGAPLAEQPSVLAALDLIEHSLAGVRAPFSFGRISRWLLSPCWAGADSERMGRARLELHLRQRRRFEWSLAAVASEAQAFDVPELVTRVSRMADARGDGTQPQRMRSILHHWGWPGPLARGEGVRRLVEGFRAVLEEVAFCGIGDDREALTVVRQLCRERRVPGPGGPLSPVQVVDLEDMPGHRFDAVWVLNVHADNWPAPVRGNRLLPFTMVRHVPRGRSEGQFQHARRTRDSVLACAPDVRFSRASQVDGTPTAPSALLGIVNPDAAPAEPEATPAATLARSAWPGLGLPASAAERDRLLPMTLEPGPTLGEGVHELKGAVGVLNTQSACPWAAFLVHRLGAVFPPTPSAFADASYTGGLVHAALERLYRPHAGTGASPGVDEVAAAVDEALTARHAALVLAPAALAAERRRLEVLLREWLAHERGLPFGAAWRLEAERDAALAGFRFTVRMDRLDRLGDGALVLDYKTGARKTPAWDRERPTQLQLPLYAVLASGDDRPVQGVGLLYVRSGDMGQVLWSADPDLKGRGMTPLTGAEAPFPDWDAAVAAWRQTLERLLREYRDGDTRFVVHDRDALRYLGLELLLRLDGAEKTEDRAHG